MKTLKMTICAIAVGAIAITLTGCDNPGRGGELEGTQAPGGEGGVIIDLDFDKTKTVTKPAPTIPPQVVPKPQPPKVNPPAPKPVT